MPQLWGQCERIFERLILSPVSIVFIGTLYRYRSDSSRMRI